MTIYDGVTFDKEKSVNIYVGEARYDKGNGSVTASGNTLNMTILTGINTLDVVIGLANAESNSNGTCKAVADGNKGKWVLGDDAQICANGNKTVGGWAKNQKGDAQTNSNELDITGGVFKDMLITGWACSLNGNATANDNITTLNKVTHSGTSVDDERRFVGGYAMGNSLNSDVQALRNNTSVTDSTMNVMRGGSATGGKTTSADSNTLVMTGGSSYKIYGGYSSATEYAYKDGKYIYSEKASACKNRLNLNGTSAYLARGAYAESYSTADASNNYLYVNVEIDKDGNQTELTTSTTITGALYGAQVEGTEAIASGNQGTLINAVFSDEEHGEFSGGIAVSDIFDGGKAESSRNNFTVKNSTFTLIYGGQAISSTNKTTATADKNVLTLSGAEVRATLYGGYADSTVDTDDDAAVSGTASAKTNTLSLYGGTYGGEIYAGYASSTNNTAESGSNTIDLCALGGVSPVFDSSATIIWGGYAKEGSTEVESTGNTLTFNNVNGMTAANIKNFQNLTFTYDDTTTLATNDVVLELKGTEDEKTTTIADGGKISVSVTSLKGEGSEAVFKKDEKVYLLKNENGLNLDEEALSLETSTAKTGGGALVCKIELRNDENNLYLTRTDSDDGKQDDDKKDDDAVTAAPETKAIAEGALAGLALVSESSEAVFEVIDGMLGQDIFAFGTVHAANKNYESGSSINVSSVSLIAGLGKGFDTDAGHLSVGAFFEYGKGSYTTHNSFDDRASIDGDGNSWYMGGGILAKMDFANTGPGHFYAEGSAHMGTVHNEFDSNDFTDGYGNVAKFDMDSPYYSLHGGLGYVWNMAEGHDLNLYGKYMWTMVQGTDDTLTTNAKFDYDDMHSNRIRAGVRYSYTGSERFKPYVGVAYEHEFAGSCESKAFGYDVNSPSYEGDTGIGELGITMTPTEALPLSFNLGVQGSVGKKRGVSGTCNVVYDF